MQPKITDYMLLSATAKQLPTLVGEYLKDGWQPLSGAIPTESGYAQTLVRYEGTKNNVQLLASDQQGKQAVS